MNKNMERLQLFEKVRVEERRVEEILHAYAREVRSPVQNPGTSPSEFLEGWKDTTNKLRTELQEALDSLEEARSNILGYCSRDLEA